MATKQVEIPGVGQVTLYKRRGNRSLRLSVDGAGLVRVSLPPWVPYKVGEQFVKSQADWIRERSSAAPTAVLTHGDAIGKSHTLYFEQLPREAEPRSKVDDAIVRISYGKSASASDSDVQLMAEKACLKALRKQAETLLPPRVELLAAEHDFSYRSVGVKQLKGRWGSCDTNKDILFNLYLMQLPWPLIDYVIMHELVHTKVMRHGPPFWSMLEAHLPNARMLRAKTKEYRPMLLPRPRSVA